MTVNYSQAMRDRQISFNILSLKSSGLLSLVLTVSTCNYTLGCAV